MANELKHGTVGTELTQAEWEGIGTHVFSSQATGDLAYASSATQLSRLAISGTATHVLSISGGVPVWAAPAAAAAGSLTGSTLASGVTASSLTSVGTIATGVWQGTTVAVNQGGTGATSLSNLIALSTMTTGNYVATVTGGTGITSTGATSGEGIGHSLSVDASQTQITSVGTIATGTWEGTTVAVNQGGTGATSLSNLIALSTMTTGNYVATVTGGTGIDSTGATSGEGIAHSLSIDLNEVGEVAIANGDYLPFMDATDSGATKKEALADIATLFSGTGLTASSSVIGVDASQTQITSVGTIGTGTWQGTTIAVNQGGTGATSLSNLIALTTMTTGNYVATVTGGTGITSTGATSGEGIAHSLSVDASQTQITAVGTIATGTWQGTDVGVAYGGTGVSTLAANSLLTGNGTSAIVAEANLTFDGSNLFLANTIGMVIGHTAQVTSDSQVFETQILGTGTADSGILIGRFDNGGGTPRIRFLKSRDPVIADGTFAIVADNDILGEFDYHGDDGADYNTRAAQFHVEVDDASPEANGIGTAFVWKQQPGGGTTAAQETMRIAADGTVLVSVGSIDLNNQSGILNVGAAGSDWDSTSLRNAADYFGINGKGMVIGHTAFVSSPQGAVAFQVLGTGNNDSSMAIGNFEAADNQAVFEFIKSKSGTIGSFGAVTASTPLGDINWGADDGTNYRSYAARIRGYSESIATENDVTGQLRFYTNGGSDNATERMRIDSAGRVQIDPLEGRVETTGGFFTIAGNNTGTAHLEISGNADTPNILLSAHHTTDAYASAFMFLKSGSATVDAHATVNDDEFLGAIGWAADDGTTYASTSARIAVEVDGTVATNKVPGRMHFMTTLEGATYPTTRMLIKATGEIDLQSNALGLTNVGASGGDWTDGKIVNTRSDSAGAVFWAQNSTTGSGSDGLYMGIDGGEIAYIWNFENTALYLATNNVARVKIDANGDTHFGANGTNQDVYFYGDTAGRDMRWDAGANAVLIDDDVYVAIGNGEDIKIYHDPDISYITAANHPLNIDLNSGILDNIANADSSLEANSWSHKTSRDGGTVSTSTFNSSGTAGSNAQVCAFVFDDGGDASFRTENLDDSGTVWLMGYDNSLDRFAITHGQGGGHGTDDALRITSAKAISFDDQASSYTTFSSDYVCDNCGKAGLEPFDCCGVVAWHDDVLALRELQLSDAGIQHMAKLGVYEIDGPDTDSPGSTFINFQKAMKYTWAGMWQNRERMDSQHQTMDARLKRIEQALGV